MSWWPLSFLFGVTHADFESKLSIAESVGCLRAAIYPWYSFRAPFQEKAIGTVTAERVRLERVRPFIRNDFKPRFVGRFVERGDRVVLAGRFSMRTSTKVFICVLLVFLLLSTIGATFFFFKQKTAY